MILANGLQKSNAGGREFVQTAVWQLIKSTFTISLACCIPVNLLVVGWMWARKLITIF